MSKEPKVFIYLFAVARGDLQLAEQTCVTYGADEGRTDIDVSTVREVRRYMQNDRETVLDIDHGVACVSDCGDDLQSLELMLLDARPADPMALARGVFEQFQAARS